MVRKGGGGARAGAGAGAGAPLCFGAEPRSFLRWRQLWPRLLQRPPSAARAEAGSPSPCPPPAPPAATKQRRLRSPARSGTAPHPSAGRAPPPPPAAAAAAGLAASDDGALCVSISRDGTVKVFDVLTFDMIVMMKLPFVPGVAEWLVKVRAGARAGGRAGASPGGAAALRRGGGGGGGWPRRLPCGRGAGGESAAPAHAPPPADPPEPPPGRPRPAPQTRPQKGDTRSRLAISDLNSPTIHVYDVRR
jgi:hypothetical protein